MLLREEIQQFFQFKELPNFFKNEIQRQVDEAHKAIGTVPQDIASFLSREHLLAAEPILSPIKDLFDEALVKLTYAIEQRKKQQQTTEPK